MGRGLRRARGVTLSLTNIARLYGPKAHVLFLTVFSIAVYVGTSHAVHRVDDPSASVAGAFAEKIA